MSDFRKLDVWVNSHALLLNVHGAAKGIRGADYLTLRNQMLRAAMSIPTNLVEGVGQKTAREFARFIRISLNSSTELEYHLLIARDFEVMQLEPYNTLTRETIEVRKMLHGLLGKVESRAKNDGKGREPRS
ncbi:MAG TPA: four helix bundle protein [Gemmatimonadaceae bacterium]